MKRNKYRLSNYLDSLQTGGQYFFSRVKVIKALGMSDIAFKLAAGRLMKKGRVQRIHADFYIIVPLEYKETGCLPPSWFISDLMKYLGARYYVGLLSAAGLYGAAHQQSMEFQVIADKTLASVKTGKLNIKFYYKNEIVPMFSQLIKTETVPMLVSTPEMTACDLVRYMDAAGQINNIATVLYELAPQLKMQRLLDYINQDYIEVSVIQRLGYLLEMLQTKLDLTELANWVKQQGPHYRLLVVGGSSTIIERDKRWHIIINEAVEPDL